MQCIRGETILYTLHLRKIWSIFLPFSGEDAPCSYHVHPGAAHVRQENISRLNRRSSVHTAESPGGLQQLVPGNGPLGFHRTPAQGRAVEPDCAGEDPGGVKQFRPSVFLSLIHI